MLYRKIFLMLIASAAIFLPSVVNAAKYQASVNFFTGDIKRPRSVYTFAMDFRRAVDLSSLKMRVADRHGEIVPIYVIPFAPYKARICFIPHKVIAEDTEVIFHLSWNTGKWSGKPSGSEKVKAAYRPGLNPIKNYGFEEVEKCDTVYSTWSGKIHPIGWKLYDHEHKYFTLKNKVARSRVSEKHSVQGERSLLLRSGLPRSYFGERGEQLVIVSGKALTDNYFKVKPGAMYELSFFLKITKKVNNERRFQGISALMILFDSNKKPLDSATQMIASYSTAFVAEEDYINRWMKVSACEKIPPEARYAKIIISSEMTGDAFVDNIELREVRQCPQPEIYIENVNEIK
ncbi:hypothetical protein P0136_12920 [Lentisphaerota bacterium ZTH]|nr:hypothetical protein JYG24_09565 [Lentisphaerota bacterium]WET06260.1 hypothetical protein P0136_12920 [Lentisphaerota bacterium ZTH]